MFLFVARLILMMEILAAGAAAPTCACTWFSEGGRLKFRLHCPLVLKSWEDRLAEYDIPAAIRGENMTWV